MYGLYAQSHMQFRNKSCFRTFQKEFSKSDWYLNFKLEFSKENGKNHNITCRWRHRLVLRFCYISMYQISKSQFLVFLAYPVKLQLSAYITSCDMWIYTTSCLIKSYLFYAWGFSVILQENILQRAFFSKKIYILR